MRQVSISESQFVEELASVSFAAACIPTLQSTWAAQGELNEILGGRYSEARLEREIEGQ